MVYVSQDDQSEMRAIEIAYDFLLSGHDQVVIINAAIEIATKKGITIEDALYVLAKIGMYLATRGVRLP